MLLTTEEVHTFYGHVHALKGASIAVDEGEIVAIVGANGAGKSTLLKTICGIAPCESGKIVYQGMLITNCDTEDLVRKGISLVPDGRHIFTDLTVFENLMLGTYASYRKISKHMLDDRMDVVYRLFPKLRDRRGQSAGTLSGGEQQMLAIGRALMSAPKLLLLDEPSTGLSPILVRALFEVIKQLRQQGVTILLVEQSATMALSVADRAYVLQTGEIVLTDSARRLLGRSDLRDAYLGRATRRGSVEMQKKEQSES